MTEKKEFREYILDKAKKGELKIAINVDDRPLQLFLKTYQQITKQANEKRDLRSYKFPLVRVEINHVRGNIPGELAIVLYPSDELFFRLCVIEDEYLSMGPDD